MALLIQNLDKFIGDADEWRRVFAEQLPDRELRIFPDAGDPADIDYLAFMRPDFDVLPELPNLRVMFTRSAVSIHLSVTRGYRKCRLASWSRPAATR